VRATLVHRQFAKIASVDREQIERDKRRRRLLRELGDAGGGGMQAELERVEVEAARSGNHDLAIDDAAGRQRGEQRLVQLGKIAIEWTQVPALDVDVIIAAKNDGAEAVPFRFEEKPLAGRKLSGELGQHGVDRRIDRKGRRHPQIIAYGDERGYLRRVLTKRITVQTSSLERPSDLNAGIFGAIERPFQTL
jgi:hypothetical protein